MKRERISLDIIDLEDRHFKISRNVIDDRLRNSIKNFGLLEAPVLIKGNVGYRAVFGINRLTVLKELGIGAADVDLYRAIDPEQYARSVLLKCARNETGPMGRLKVVALLHELGVDPDRKALIALKGLQVPGDFIGEQGIADRALQLPQSLKDYLDSRDVQFKTIRDLVGLPADAIGTISNWLSFAALRVNIFRSIIDMLSDIYARDGSVSFVKEIKPGESADKRRWEDLLHGLIARVRYPEYSALKQRADGIVRYFSARGIRIEYPAYFEGDRVDVTLTINKRDDPASIRTKIAGADFNRLKELLDMM